LVKSKTLIAYGMAVLMPAVSAAVGVLIFFIFWNASHDSAWQLDIFVMLFGLFLFFGIVFASVSCAVIGIPAHLALKRLNWTSQSAYALTGIMSSSGLAASFWFITGKPSLYLLEGIVISTIFFGGPISAITFWRIIRPDRTGKSIHKAVDHP
jgi:hypothetical protein